MEDKVISNFDYFSTYSVKIIKIIDDFSIYAAKEIPRKIEFLDGIIISDIHAIIDKKYELKLALINNLSEYGDIHSILIYENFSGYIETINIKFDHDNYLEELPEDLIFELLLNIKHYEHLIDFINSSIYIESVFNQSIKNLIDHKFPKLNIYKSVADVDLKKLYIEILRLVRNFKHEYQYDIDDSIDWNLFLENFERGSRVEHYLISTEYFIANNMINFDVMFITHALDLSYKVINYNKINLIKLILRSPKIIQYIISIIKNVVERINVNAFIFGLDSFKILLDDPRITTVADRYIISSINKSLSTINYLKLIDLLINHPKTRLELKK